MLMRASFNALLARSRTFSRAKAREPAEFPRSYFLWASDLVMAHNECPRSGSPNGQSDGSPMGGGIGSAEARGAESVSPRPQLSLQGGAQRNSQLADSGSAKAYL